jgi:ATP-dependent Clp protease ATP-binding subunit ClpB
MVEGNKQEVLDKMRSEVFGLLRKSIRPEFLNRIDEVIMFTPLSREEIRDIVKLQFGQLEKMLAANDISLEISDDAVDLIARLGYDPQYGARPIKRVLQRNLVNELSKMVLAGQVDRSKPIRVETADGKLEFRN